ncbi:hypothetical protein DL98DRAFT_651587 [Cadophora sp. DSE1049]|nr:hypothetical protein DL98DRAFT_651587 [Cadophora sp. DSE1049]
MGLPLFITPVEPEVASKAAEKIASGPRSSIRRQRTLRGPHARLTSEARRRRILGMMPEAEPEEFEVSEGQQGSMADLPSLAPLHSRAMRIVEQERERARMRDALSFERQHPLNSDIDGPLMPPVPESRDYSFAEERQREIHRLRQVRQDLRRMARRHPAPTPPYTDSDLAFLARTDSPRLSSSMTPVLSPSHQPSIGDSFSPPRRSLEDAEFSFTSVRGPFTDSMGRSSTSLSERVRSLNQTASNIERSRRLIRQARLDGLGDRDRSMSPEGGAAWDTLLTSITPDPQPPSAGSSFASTSAAAAAASSSGSGPSSGSASASASTLMTSPDRVGDHECDVSDSGSNTEDEEEDIYELQEFNGSRRGDRFWRTYADVVTARADRAARQDTDLGGMHRIISRLARRDEIPDNWWTSAGLSRNLRREPTN